MDLSSDQICFAQSRYAAFQSKVLGVVVIGFAAAVATMVADINWLHKHTGALGPCLFIFFLLVGALGGACMKMPFRWQCPACEKTISSDEPWRCGACDHEHKEIKGSVQSTFLENCAGPRCSAAPTAYECQYCRTVMFLTPERKCRNPARSLDPRPIAMPTEPSAPGPTNVRSQRQDELEGREYVTKNLEIDHRQLELEIKNAKLAQSLEQVAAAKPTREQERDDLVKQLIEEAELAYRTIPETIDRELAAHAAIDARRFHPNSDVDAYLKEQTKKVVSLKYEAVRHHMGGNVRVQQKDRPETV